MKSQEVQSNFTYHAPSEEQITRYRKIRDYAQAFSSVILDNSPYSEEQTLSLRKLQECVMWVNAAIAINEDEID